MLCCTSPMPSSLILPTSKDTRAPSASLFFLNSSPIWRTISPLFGAGIYKKAKGSHPNGHIKAAKKLKAIWAYLGPCLFDALQSLHSTVVVINRALRGGKPSMLCFSKRNFKDGRRYGFNAGNGLVVGGIDGIHGGTASCRPFSICEDTIIHL